MAQTVEADSSLQVEITPHPLGLRARIQGAETYANTLGYWLRIAPHLDTLQGRGVLLIDELVGDGLSEQQWLELVLAMEFARLDRFRIAHVRPNGLREIEYCELFARDQNMDARVFVDEAEAVRWLAQS